MGKQEDKAKRVHVYQSVGFLAIIALCWMDEFANLPFLILGNNPYIADFRESTLKMLLVLAVWLLVGGSTRRCLAHLRYLESFMKVCAWCRRIEHNGQWVHLDEFLRQGFNTPTSHGICDHCLEKQKIAIERAKEQRLASGSQPELKPEG